MLIQKAPCPDVAQEVERLVKYVGKSNFLNHLMTRNPTLILQKAQRAYTIRYKKTAHVHICSVLNILSLWGPGLGPCPKIAADSGSALGVGLAQGPKVNTVYEIDMKNVGCACI